MIFLRYGSALLLGLIAGFCIGHFGHQIFSVDFKKELGLGDVMNFTVAIIFAFLLQNYFQKRFSDKRSEKDHLISLIVGIQGTIGQIRKEFGAVYASKRLPPAYKSSVLTYFRNLSNEIDLLKHAFDECSISSEVENCKELQTLYVEYKRSLTGSGFPSKPYGPDALSDSEKIANKLQAELTKMRIRVNKT